MIKSIGKFLKKHRWISLIFEVALIVALMLAISWWQNRGELPGENGMAPDFTLQALDGSSHRLSDYRGKKVVLYFFAPWCSICHLSAPNLKALKKSRSPDELQILLVGLSYNTIDELKKFADDLNLQDIPVLIGNDQLMQDYRIKAFPTYFIIDENGRITSRSIGYSTELGLRLRT